MLYYKFHNRQRNTNFEPMAFIFAVQRFRDYGVRLSRTSAVR